jgi:serine/arginine repetitive matrix protein 2
MKRSPLNQSITLPLERPSTPELPPPPTVDTDAGTKVDETVVQDVPDKMEEELVQDEAAEVNLDSTTVVEEEIVHDVQMEDLSKPSAPVAETRPLPPATQVVEQVAVESTILGLETGRLSAKNTPPILVSRLPPVTTGPTPPDSAFATTPRLPERRSTPRMRFADLPSDVKPDDVAQKNGTRSTSTSKDDPPDVFGQDTVETVVDETVEVEITNDRTPNTVTIAERRAVTLPPNVVPPPRTHAGSRMRKSYPAESIVSGQPSPRTEASSAAPSELSGEERALKIAAAIKSAQRDHPSFEPLIERQIELVNTETSKNAPRSDSPSPERNVDDLVKRVCEEMEARYSGTRMKGLIQTRLRREAEARKIRHAKLRRQYESLKQRWEENHQVLDAQMAERPPMPSKIYEMILSRKETEELAIIDESSRNRNRQATQAQLEAVMEASRLDDELHPNRLADINGVEIPDMLSLEERRCVYDDDNDLVKDPLQFYDFAGNSEAIWTDAEKAVFAKIFPNCQKQFGKIADKLPGKSVGDCVLYYYRTKKDLEWKREPAKGTIAAKKVAKPAKRGPKPSLPDRSPSPPVGMPTPAARGGAVGGRGRGRGRLSGISTPGDKPGRRKASAIDTLLEGQSSETTSRAASETPAAGKGKPRIPKAKRPRESSVLDPSGLSAQVNETETPTAEDPDAESLPTAKRGGKRRKVGPDGQPIEGEEKGDKRRRAGQNSYWNNDEKAAFARLSALYPGDFARIAHELGNTKTVKQVENWNTKIAAEETKQPVPVSSIYVSKDKANG